MPHNPALNGFNVPSVGDEPDYSEHVVRCAWFRGMDGQRSEREVIVGEDPLSGEISPMHTALNFRIPPFSRVRLASFKESCVGSESL